MANEHDIPHRSASVAGKQLAGTMGALKSRDARTTPVASILDPDGGNIRVSLIDTGGVISVDLRAFDIITPAKVPTPTKNGVTVSMNGAQALLFALMQAIEIGGQK